MSYKNISFALSFFLHNNLTDVYIKIIYQCIIQEQHIAEEMDTEIAAYRSGKEITDEEQEPSEDIPRRYIPNLKEMRPKVNYDYNQRRYHMPRVGQAWSVSSLYLTCFFLFILKI